MEKGEKKDVKAASVAAIAMVISWRVSMHVVSGTKMPKDEGSKKMGF